MKRKIRVGYSLSDHLINIYQKRKQVSFSSLLLKNMFYVNHNKKNLIFLLKF